MGENVRIQCELITSLPEYYQCLERVPQKVWKPTHRQCSYRYSGFIITLSAASHNPAESLENKTDNSVCVTERENSDKGVRKADLYMCVLSVSVFILTSFCLSKTWCWLDWSLIFYIRTTTVLIKAIIFKCKCCELATFTLSEWT